MSERMRRHLHLIHRFKKMESTEVYCNFSELLLTEESFSSRADSPSRDQEDFGCVFLSRPPADLTCRVCRLVLRDPHQTLCCGNHYCRHCLRLQLAVRGECAFCSARQVRSFPDVNVARRVNRLRIKCPHSERGCEWEGELFQVGDHLTNCSATPRACKTCGGIFSREKVEQHELKFCEKRSYRCPYCKRYSSTYENVRDSHWPKCLYYPIFCPNECSKCYIPRRDVLKHLRDKCEVKKKVKEMSQSLEHLESELTSKNAVIEELKTKMSQKCESCHPMNLEKDNAQLVVRITEIQRERAETEHDNLCLRQDLEQRDKKIRDLETQNRNLRNSLGHMERDLGTQLQAMKDLCQTLREEKEELERRLMSCGDGENPLIESD